MFDKIKAFLNGPDAPSRKGGFEEIQVAVVALLVRAASTADSQFDDKERATIAQMASDHFGLDRTEVDALIELATADEQKTLDLHRWAQAIKKHYEEAERISLIDRKSVV